MPAGRSVVRFDVIGQAFDLFRAELGAWLIAGVVVLVLNSTLTGLAREFLGQALPHAGGGFRVAVPPSGRWLLAFLAAVLNGFLLAGLIRMACVQVRGGRPTLRDFRAVFENPTEIGIASAIYVVVVGAAGCLFVVPAFIAAGLLMFMMPLVMDGRLTGAEAARQSFFALRGQWFGATIFHLVLSFITGLGFCCCGVGGLVTMPLYSLSIALLYRDFFVLKAAEPKPKPAGFDPDFG